MHFHKKIFIKSFTNNNFLYIILNFIFRRNITRNTANSLKKIFNSEVFHKHTQVIFLELICNKSIQNVILSKPKPFAQYFLVFHKCIQYFFLKFFIFFFKKFFIFFPFYPIFFYHIKSIYNRVIFLLFLKLKIKIIKVKNSIKHSNQFSIRYYSLYSFKCYLWINH